MNTKKCITDTSESSSEFADAKRKTFLREGFAVPDLSYRTIPFYHLEGDVSRYDVKDDDKTLVDMTSRFEGNTVSYKSKKILVP